MPHRVTGICKKLLKCVWSLVLQNNQTTARQLWFYIFYNFLSFANFMYSIFLYFLEQQLLVISRISTLWRLEQAPMISQIFGGALQQLQHQQLPGWYKIQYQLAICYILYTNNGIQCNQYVFPHLTRDSISLSLLCHCRQL